MTRSSAGLASSETRGSGIQLHGADVQPSMERRSQEDRLMSNGRDVLELVPEVYFDLIARIVPGGVTLVAMTVNRTFVESPLALGKAGLVLVGLLCAYALGLVLDVFGDLVGTGITLLWNETTETTKARTIRSNLEVCQDIDALGDRRLASVLTKLMAEKVLTRSLCLLSILLVVPGITAISGIAPWMNLASAGLCGALTMRIEYHLRTRIPSTGQRAT